MYPGYMTIDGVEILNAHRTKTYANALIPSLAVRCDASGLRLALLHSPYTTPALDGAPWYKVTRPATGRFVGFHCLGIDGIDDSSETVEVTELIGSGGVHTIPRHGTREFRVKAVALAMDDEAMEEGWAWLKSVLSNAGCADGTLGCTGRTLRMFSAPPVTSSDATRLGRNFYRVEKLEGPRVVKRHASPSATVWEIEFVLSAGVPWAWTDKEPVATLNMDLAANFTEPVENCSDVGDPYNDFINDPFFTAITQPPRPPVIVPPNVLDLSSWRRLTVGIPTLLTGRSGRAVPIATITAGAAAAEHVRLRFYSDEAGVSGCDFDGELLVSYIPANAVMTLNGTTRETTVRLSDGRVVPGAHLLYGSDGRPPLWPSLGCGRTYTMTADMKPAQTGIVVGLDVAVRE